jgi:hypothetical protein
MERIRTHLRRGESMSLAADKAVAGLLGLLGFKPDLAAVFETWDKEAGALVRGCEATGIQGTRLTVRVPSTVHRQELLYCKERLINRLNQAMGRKVITDIQFELAPGAEQANTPTGGSLRDKVKRFGFQRYRQISE